MNPKGDCARKFREEGVAKGVLGRKEGQVSLEAPAEIRGPRAGSTCITSVHDELCHLEGVPLREALAPDPHLASVSDLRRPHQDLEGAVGDVLTTLAHAHHMLPHLLGGEGDACGEAQVNKGPGHGRGTLPGPSGLPRGPPLAAHSPMCRLGKRFSRQGSSLPEGARMLAVSKLRSLSVIFSDTSVEVPTFSCDVLMESSPGGDGVSGSCDSRQALPSRGSGDSTDWGLLTCTETPKAWRAQSSFGATPAALGMPQSSMG